MKVKAWLRSKRVRIADWYRLRTHLIKVRMRMAEPSVTLKIDKATHEQRRRDTVKHNQDLSRVKRNNG